MKPLYLKIFTMTVLGVVLVLLPFNVQADNCYFRSMPNVHGKSLTTPVGWGAAYNVGFIGVGGTSRAPYTNDADGGFAVGVGVGNPIKYAGLQASISGLDLSNWNRYALNLHLHRYLGQAASIAVGVESIMLVGMDRTDADKSYYVVVSKGVQHKCLVNMESKRTRLHYSIGVGKGRFSEKSPDDSANGKGDDGTWVFGNVSYELFNSFNGIVDWNGVNLNAGISKTFMSRASVPIIVGIGVADLTDNSGDGLRLIGSIGTGFRL